MATAGVGDIFGEVGLIADNKFNILREIGRAGAHSATQGAIAVLRGGNFWQGAASGALGSIGGSIAQGYGITNFWGTVTISSVSGGIGAYIGGARSAEDILFGMATGAIVGALNHSMHEGQRKIEMKNVWGKMYIISNVGPDAELTDGHAWIRLESKDGNIVKTMSLWGNKGKQEYWENLEINKGYGVVNKSVSISVSMYNRISVYNNSSNTNWTFFNTCAGYSAGLWNYITNQNLSARDDYFFTTPRALSNSIQNSN